MAVVTIFVFCWFYIFNLEGYQNCMIGSRVTKLLMKYEKMFSTPRHGICQKVYTGKDFKDQILPKCAWNSMNTRLQQNSVNYGKIQ